MLASLYYHTRDLYLFKTHQHFKVEKSLSFITLVCVLGLVASVLATLSIWQFNAHLNQELSFTSLFVDTSIRHFFVGCLLFLVASPQKILNLVCLICSVHLATLLMACLLPILGAAASTAILLSFCGWSTVAFFKANKNHEGAL